MQDRTLYALLLGIEAPWAVTDVTLRLAEEHAVVVRVAMDLSGALPCPRCQAPCPRYDYRERRWRHLDTMQYRTVLIAEVPRVRCGAHGVVQIAVPWADPAPGSRRCSKRWSLIGCGRRASPRWRAACRSAGRRLRASRRVRCAADWRAGRRRPRGGSGSTRRRFANATSTSRWSMIWTATACSGSAMTARRPP